MAEPTRTAPERSRTAASQILSRRQPRNQETFNNRTEALPPSINPTRGNVLQLSEMSESNNEEQRHPTDGIFTVSGRQPPSYEQVCVEASTDAPPPYELVISLV